MENLFLIIKKMNLNVSFPESYLRENLSQSNSFRNNIIEYFSRVARGVAPGNSFQQGVSALLSQLSGDVQPLINNIDITLAGVAAGITGLPDNNPVKIAGLEQANLGNNVKQFYQELQTKVRELTPQNLESFRTDLQNIAVRARNAERDIQTRFNQTVAAVQRNLPATLDERLNAVVQSARLHAQEVSEVAKKIIEKAQTVLITL